jgi:dTDP-4-amino-4,6-dideoxygalactose transaminase
MNREVPFLDLITPHREQEEAFTGVVRDAFRTGRFIGGPMVEDFEREFARSCSTSHCAGVGSGTDALRFALLAAGVKAGDVVVTVPFTFIATTEAISQCGARPAFVDIDPVTFSMDPDRLRNFLERDCRKGGAGGALLHAATGRPVTAVVPVHLYGQPAPMNAILALAEEHGLTVIEDACQAHGAEYYDAGGRQWRKAGSMGKAAAFSFYPGKNLGACGEAGAVTTNDPDIDRTVRMLRDHGQITKYTHLMEGYNGRLDAIQAGFLSIKLRSLPEGNERRVHLARRYRELLSGVEGVELPETPDWARPVFHLYVVRTRHRDELQSFLSRRGIGTGLHYPVPLHLQKPYAELGYGDGDFPVSENAAREVLSLPLFPGLSDNQQQHVVESILQFQTSGKHVPVPDRGSASVTP